MRSQGGVDPTQSWRRCMGSRRVAAKARGGSCIFLMHQRFFRRKCNRLRAFAFGSRNGFGSQKTKENNVTCCFFGEGAAGRRRVS